MTARLGAGASRDPGTRPNSFPARKTGDLIMTQLDPDRFAELTALRERDGSPYDVTFTCDTAEEWKQERDEAIQRLQRRVRDVTAGWDALRGAICHPSNPHTTALVAMLPERYRFGLRRLASHLQIVSVPPPARGAPSKRDAKRFSTAISGWFAFLDVIRDGHPLYRDAFAGLDPATQVTVQEITRCVPDPARLNRRLTTALTMGPYDLYPVAFAVEDLEAYLERWHADADPAEQPAYRRCLDAVRAITAELGGKP